jgi:hypothetical protein
VSIANTAAASGSVFDFSMQYGVNAMATPDDVLVAEFLRHVLLVTRPPQLKLITPIATAPFSAGFV